MYFKLEVEVPMLSLTTLKVEPKILNAETYAKTEEEAKQEVCEFYAQDMGVSVDQIKVISITSVEAEYPLDLFE